LIKFLAQNGNWKEERGDTVEREERAVGRTIEDTISLAEFILIIEKFLKRKS